MRPKIEFLGNAFIILLVTIVLANSSARAEQSRMSEQLDTLVQKADSAAGKRKVQRELLRLPPKELDDELELMLKPGSSNTSEENAENPFIERDDPAIIAVKVIALLPKDRRRFLLPYVTQRMRSPAHWKFITYAYDLTHSTAEEKPFQEALLYKLDGSCSTEKLMALQLMNNIPIPSSVFDRLVKDDSSQVRISTVIQYKTSWKSLPASEQSRRLYVLLRLKPYQARISAFIFLNDLKRTEQEILRSSFEPALCAGEKNEEVMKVCLDAARALGYLSP